MKILIVDDSRTQAFLLAAILASGNYLDVIKARSATEAFQILGLAGTAPTATVDLILMDLDMPEMDGLEACRHIKAAERLHDVPIIVVTASPDIEDLRAAFEAGASDYISKPPNDVELLARVRAALRLKQEIDQRRASEIKLGLLLRRFVALNVAEHLIHEPGLPHLGGERRVVSVLFADMRNYTTWAETLSPEKAMDTLNEHFAILGRLIVEHGGTINQYAGDQIMALFNAPDDQPDHALRAVRAALAMQAALITKRQLAPEEHRAWIAQLGIGINTGPTVAGYLGFEERFDYTAIGDTTNVAARLAGVAHGGQIVIGEETYQSVRSIISTRPVGPLTLKGKSTQVTAYEVIGG